MAAVAASARLERGDRVAHPKLGLGEVVGLDGEKARIFFVDSGHRTILTSRFPLQPLVPRPSHWRLDGMDFSSTKATSAYRSARDFVHAFECQYPGGFKNDEFIKEERKYKAEAHEAALELLDEGRLIELLAAERYGEVCIRAKDTMKRVNVVDWRESQPLWSGLSDHGGREEAFAKRLHALLYGQRSEQHRFEAFSSLMEELSVPKWPICTFWRWIVFPNEEVFVKPASVKAAADAWSYDLGYSPGPSWAVYRRIRGLLPPCPRGVGGPRTPRLHRRADVHVVVHVVPEPVAIGPRPGSLTPRKPIDQGRLCVSTTLRHLTAGRS